MKRDRAKSILHEHMNELRERFGSVLREDFSDESDVDVLVEFNRPTGLFGLFRLQDRLEELFGCPVDLGTAGSLKPRMQERVRKERVDVA